jgi:hypothetical protein
VFNPPPPSTTPAVTLNSVDLAVADIRGMNDFRLKGYEAFTSGWYTGPGQNMMGTDTNMETNQATWSIYYKNPAYVGVVTKAMLPWVVVFDGTGNGAVNTAVEMRNFRAYIKNKAGVWRSMGGPVGVSGDYYPKAGVAFPSQSGVVLSSTPTSTIVKIHDNSNLFWHGWWTAGRVAIDPYDIAAIFVTVQARLVPEGSNDDRANAQLGLQIGADFYVTTDSVWKESYAPGIGIARTKRLTNEWQAFSYVTLTDVGEQQPGSGITEAQFRAAPPPLE